MSAYEILKSDELSSITLKSRRALLERFKSLDEVSAKDFYIDIVKAVQDFITVDTIQPLKHLSWLLTEIGKYNSQTNLQYYFDSTKIAIQTFNPIILACKSKAINVLRHIFESKNKTLYNLSCQINRKVISPNDHDEFNHNAFYYAVRSNITDILNILINKWPNNYFDENMEELDNILSRSYNELKLRNVFLTKEMEVFVQTELFNNRFYHSNSKDLSTGSSEERTQKRVELVIENIELIKSTYWDSDPDEEFLLVAEFIAKNIHVLKSFLKFTYDKLPWEEIEFCLAIFIKCRKSFKENLVYNTVLKKNKLLIYLEQFSIVLQSEMENIACGDMKRKFEEREKIVENIIKNHSIFKDLYADYEIVRDFCSLDTIKDYTNLAMSADVSTEEGKLLVIRALQVTGEHIKNTLFTPKLSHTKAHVLLYSLPLYSRKIIAELRNCLSHDDNLRVRSEIERQSFNFFKDIQGDVLKLNTMATETLSDIKIEQIKILLLKLKQCKYWRQVNHLFKTYSFSFESIVTEINKLESGAWNKSDIERLQELLLILSGNMGERTEFENKMFEEINSLMRSEKYYSKAKKEDLSLIIHKLDQMSRISQAVDVDEVFNYDLESFEYKFENTDTSTSLLFDLIHETVRQLLESVIPRVDLGNIELRCIISKIFYLIKFQMGKVKWIEEFAEIICSQKQKKKRSKGVKFNEILSSKVFLLKKILTENNLADNLLLANLSFFENNRKLQVVLEILILDIMSLLESSCSFNNFFLDNDYILLTGRNLRNNLAHMNSLVNDISPIVSLQLLLNAQALVAASFSCNSKKLGLVEKCDPYKLEITHNKNLFTVRNQKALFVAFSKGNMKHVRKSMREGADIFGKDLKSTSCLHFSSKAPDTEAVKYAFEQGLDLNSKDFDYLTALHFAAKYNRLKTVEYLLTRGVCVNTSNVRGLTPLHMAAENNSLGVVKYLLEHKANASTTDFHLPPLHYAICKGNIEVAKIFLENETNVDKIKAHGGFTALYTAAEIGNPYLVRLLIQKKASILSKDDFENTPLHIAAFKSHLKVVEILISKGADVNAKNIAGNTPLHGASQSGNEHIVRFLLLHGADGSVRNDHLCLPLHFASEKGHLGISELFLTKDSTLVNAKGNEGQTPLHLAAVNGHTKLVNLLLKFKAVPDSKDNNNATALHASVCYGHLNVVQSLIENGANIEIEEKTEFGKPLHLASREGYLHIVEYLVSKGADIHSRAVFGRTSLEIAALRGYTDIVKFLISKGAHFPENYVPRQLNLTIFNAVSEILLDENIDKTLSAVENFEQLLYLAASFGGEPIIKFCLKKDCNVNVKNNVGLTALHFAALNNHPVIVRFLLDNGADIDAKDNNNDTALCLAAKRNGKEAVCILIDKQTESKQCYISERSRSLYMAVASGHSSVVDVLFQRCQFDVTSLQKHYDFLHKASEFGHRKVVEILLNKGFEPDFLWNNRTPVYYAILNNHCEVTRLLISAGANVNNKEEEGKTALHWIVEVGSVEQFQIALNAGADVCIRDKKHRSVIEVAVSNNRIEMVEILLQKEDIDINSKGNEGYSLLHLSTEIGSLEITKLLTLKGSNMRSKDMNGSKPVHIAAKMGHKDIVGFYLDNNISVNDLGNRNFTPLHFAALAGKINVCEYLIERGANINAFAENGITPLHLAATNDNEEVLRILLHSGAYYNTGYTSLISQLPMTRCATFLKKIERLFIIVQKNDHLEVENHLEKHNRNPKFSIVNAKCVRNETPLLYASREGCDKMVDILLKFQANPNICDKHKRMPLHYSAQFSHLNIVKALLRKGAIFNPVCFRGKTPLEYTTDLTVINLLRFANKVFSKITVKCNSVLNELKNSKNEEFSKVILRAKDRKGNTLVAAAILNDFPKIEQLKELFQDDIIYLWKETTVITSQQNSTEALNKLKTVLDRRNEIFGDESPATLDVKEKIARCLLNVQKSDEALDLLHEIYQKRKNIFSENHKETLTVKCLIASIFHQQGKTSEASKLFKEVFKHKNLFEKNNYDILYSEMYMSGILGEKKCFVEALYMINDVLDRSNKAYGPFHKITVDTLWCKGRILQIQGNLLKAKELFEEVYNIIKNRFQPFHEEVLLCRSNIAKLLLELKKYDESFKMLKKIRKILNCHYPPNHLFVLSNESDTASIFFAQGMTIKALKMFLTIESKVTMFGDDHPLVKMNKADIERAVFRLRAMEDEWIVEKIRNEMHLVESDNPLEKLKHLEGKMNSQDEDGKTALLMAVVNGEREKTNTLLEKGADIFMTATDGSTVLHIAVARGYDDLAERIFNHAEKQNHLSTKSLINAKDNSLSTALHFVSNVKTAKWLLRHGAIYNAKNRLGQTPLDLARDMKISSFLKKVNDLFNAARNGRHSFINELDGLDHEESLAAANTRNREDHSLLQVAIVNNQKNLAREIGNWLKKINIQVK